METLRSLKEKGKCIILITHKLAEVRMVTDRITVMRAGVVTARVNTADTDEKKIAMMMVGREVILEVDKQPFHPGETVLSLKNISCFDRMGLPAVRDVSFDVHRGEVVGIAGVQGNGQSELADAVAGLLPLSHGEVFLNGKLMSGEMFRCCAGKTAWGISTTTESMLAQPPTFPSVTTSWRLCTGATW